MFSLLAAAVNCGYTTVGDAAVIQPFLSLIETVYVPAGTLNVGLV
jgi:hypothetical protein